MRISRARFAVLLTVGLALVACAEPKGVFKYVNVDVPYILEAYSQMTGAKLVMGPGVEKAHGKVSLQSEGPTTAPEAARMIERALADQAGVVLTRLGDNRVSVTYDEALEKQAMLRLSRQSPPRTAARPADDSPQYEVRGEVSWIGSEGKYVDGGKRTSGFIVSVKGAQWAVTVFPSNWPTRIRFEKKVPAPLSETLSCDGTNGYSLEVYPPGESRHSQFGNRWIGNTPAGHGSARELYPLWYAFASHHYGRTLSTNNILGLEPGIPVMEGVLKTNAAFPHLPLSVTGTNAKQTLRWEFKVTAFTNAFGLTLPAEAVARYTSKTLKVPEFSEPWSSVVLKVHAIRPRSEMTSFVPDLNDNQTVIDDWTYKNGNPPHEARIISDRWPTAAEVNAFYFR